MTKHIFMFVKGWNPKYSDPTVLNDILPLKGKRTVTRSPRGMQQRRKKEHCMRGRRRNQSDDWWLFRSWMGIKYQTTGGRP